MTFFESLLTSFLFSGLWVVAIAFLGRSLLGNLLAKDLEKFRGQIAIQNIEKQIVLARMHEKRAESVSKIYQGLVAFLKESKSFVHQAEHVEEEERKILLSSLGEMSVRFKEIFQMNHLYLKKQTCDNIQNLFDEAQIPVIKFSFALGKYKSENNFSEEQFAKEFHKAFVIFADKIPPLLEDLEGEFRSLLGVEE
jgi:hypothetical protein